MTSTPNRRRFLQRSLTLAPAAALGVIGGTAARAATVAAPRRLALAHTHTGERTDLVYADAGDYLPPALQHLNVFLRDHHNGQVGQMDPQLYDLLHGVQRLLAWERGFHVISAYRSPATNLHLQRSRGGGVATQSLHLSGRAIDVRLPGVPLAELRDAALALKAGGVGHYPREDFVHIDTGRVRRW